jgi:hypothetical protein
MLFYVVLTLSSDVGLTTFKLGAVSENLRAAPVNRRDRTGRESTRRRAVAGVKSAVTRNAPMSPVLGCWVTQGHCMLRRYVPRYIIGVFPVSLRCICWHIPFIKLHVHDVFLIESNITTVIWTLLVYSSNNRITHVHTQYIHRKIRFNTGHIYIYYISITKHMQTHL